MQQELWLQAKSQVLSSIKSSIKPFSALRAASAASFHPLSSTARPSHPLVRATDYNPQATMSLSGSFPNNNNHTHTNVLLAPRTPSLGLHSRTTNNTPQSHHKRGQFYHYNTGHCDNGVKTEFKRSSSAEVSSGQSNPIKASRTHQELHKELLLAHTKGLGLASRPELQQVLERRKREQSDREEEEQTRSPLEEVLLKRQQKQLEREKQQEEKVQEEAQLMEFVRVRQNLRKIHTAIQNKASNP
ncbi:uncharacterized protein [Centroberyx affinis]|uniref:uncharacterized protein n=1 Tax=Centroberyx affinis TaxID=166261 RepID=UPI003A5BC7C5